MNQDDKEMKLEAWVPCLLLKMSTLLHSDLRILPYQDILRCASLAELDVCTDDSLAEHLGLLRDKAHAWFKFNTQPVKTALIIPILPKLSQRAIEREWVPELLCSVPDAHSIDVLMDPGQSPVAAAFGWRWCPPQICWTDAVQMSDTSGEREQVEKTPKVTRMQRHHSRAETS
ncbi:hypothetical protein DFH29DRAFT_882022 [Suillus ampliporus]|nr:hypothetical protein DFH29DRAFT_882022 [Suillus ampliporus]